MMDIMLHELTGDAQLSTEPYTAESHDGAVISMASNTQQDLHMTYYVVSNVAQGLLAVLISQGRFKAARFDIYVAGFGRVGTGNIRPSAEP